MELKDVKQYLKPNKNSGQDLKLAGKAVSQLPDLSSFKKLQHIEVQSNNLKSLDFLSGATSLKGINISGLLMVSSLLMRRK